jgi:hypothetical protein
MISTRPGYSMVSNSVGDFGVIGAESTGSAVIDSGFDDRCKERAQDRVQWRTLV